MAKGGCRDDKSISSNLYVDPSTVHRIMKRFNESGGSVSKKEHPKDCRVLKLTKPVEAGNSTLNMLMHTSGAYLREVQEELSRVYGVNVHQSMLCQFLKKSGFTRQKMKIATARKDKQ